MPINKQLKVKLISMLIGLSGFSILSIVGMNLFQNLMTSVTSMSMTASTGMVEIPSINDFFMQFIDQKSMVEIAIGIVFVIAGGIGYIWYPIMEFKNQISGMFNNNDDSIDELIKKHCYK